MATLITGIEGFLGHRVAETLHANGTQVVGLDVIAGNARPWPVITGDVTDRSLVERIFAEHDVTAVIHCGGVSGPHVCNNDPARVFHVNLGGTLNLFEVARLRKIPGRIVFLSSSSTYGEPAEESSRKTPIGEHAPLLANEPYGCSKVACESLLRAYATQFNVDAVALRVSIVYGPGRTTYCGITRQIRAALAGQPIPLDQASDFPLPWVHIEDVCSAIITALTVPREKIRDRDTLAYNVTGPGYPTFRQIAAVVQSLVPGSTVKEQDTPDAYAMNARTMALAAIKKDLGWEPTTTIEAGVRSLFETMKG
jgi:UDP-glucose 4-epimerase/UDP-glucuronate 4-epimerase